MRVKVGNAVHELQYYDGLFVDTRCGQRIMGQNSKAYTLISARFAEGNHDNPIRDVDITCEECKREGEGK